MQKHYFLLSVQNELQFLLLRANLILTSQSDSIISRVKLISLWIKSWIQLGPLSFSVPIFSGLIWGWVQVIAGGIGIGEGTSGWRTLFCCCFLFDQPGQYQVIFSEGIWPFSSWFGHHLCVADPLRYLPHLAHSIWSLPKCLLWGPWALDFGDSLVSHLLWIPSYFLQCSPSWHENLTDFFHTLWQLREPEVAFLRPVLSLDLPCNHFCCTLVFPSQNSQQEVGPQALSVWGSLNPKSITSHGASTPKRGQGAKPHLYI